MTITSTDANETNSSMALIDSKFTADQIETDCPARLQEIRREFAERVARGREHVREAEKLFGEDPSKNAEEWIALMQRASDYSNGIIQLLSEAKVLCDHAGFDLFCEKLLDQLLKEFPQPTTENSE
jgi:hypothetical protein